MIDFSRVMKFTDNQMAKRKMAGPIKESSQTTKEKETSVSHSAVSTKESSDFANYGCTWPLYGPVPDRECLFAPVLEMLKIVRSTSGEILAKPFLVVCRHTSPITRMFIIHCCNSFEQSIEPVFSFYFSKRQAAPLLLAACTWFFIQA